MSLVRSLPASAIRCLSKGQGLRMALRVACGSCCAWRISAANTLSVIMPPTLTNIRNRERRSTSVATWLFLPLKSKSPSQWPGTVRSSNFDRKLTDRNDVNDLPPGLARRRGRLGTTHQASTAQGREQLPLQDAAGKDEQALVDGLV